ncbi:MAG: PQQ-binding-like beta-propeller repeat protein, partial [Spirochaetales bacterium]|nr:PQQ-binding-like beta-propeller repeat protein [Spirochaetales bacterium]
AAGLALAVALLAGCGERSDWVMFRGEQGRGATPTRLSPPLAVKWKLQLQASAEPTYAFNNPVVLDGTIYFGSTDGNFYALDIVSGYMNWVFKTRGAINSVPFADRENVYFGNNVGKVYAVRREDAQELWSFQTDSTVQSTIVGYEDTLIFSSDGGTTYFVDPNGRELFTLPNPVWHYNTFQVHDDVVYFAPGPPTRPHAFGAFDLPSRSYLWILDTQLFGAIWYSFPALSGELLHFATATYNGPVWSFDYYAFDRRSGEVVWKYSDFSDWGPMGAVDSEGMFSANMKLLDYMAPAVWKNRVIYCSGDTVVRAFGARGGSLAWSRSFPVPTSSAPTVAGNRVYLGLQGRGMEPPRLVCLSARNGRLLWEIELDGALLSAPVVAGRWIVFGTDRNFFYVLEELY